MKFAYTILYVADVAKTIAFYESAFGFARKFVTPEGDYGELICGETTLSFASHELGESNFEAAYQKTSLDKAPFGLELAFTTEDIDTDFQNALDNGATLLSKVIEKPWGQKVGYLKDINGFIIEVCTPMPN